MQRSLPGVFPHEGVMKTVVFAVLVTALALFLLLPNLSWAF